MNVTFFVIPLYVVRKYNTLLAEQIFFGGGGGRSEYFQIRKSEGKRLPGKSRRRWRCC
jgi:hypothetical protein